MAKRIQHVKQAYHDLAVKSEQTVRIPTSIKMMRLITSRWVAVALYLVFAALFIGLHLLLYFVAAQQSCTAFSSMVRISVLIVYMSLVLLVLIVLMLDLYESREDCFAFKCWRPYTRDDPLLYRSELSLLVLVIPCLLIGTVVLSLLGVSTDLTAAIVKICADVASLFILPELSFISVIWHEYKLVKVSKKQSESRKSLTMFNPSEDTIRNILADTLVSRNFVAYAKREYSLENVYFFDQVQQFRAKPSFEAAKKIYDMYLAPSACLEVNVNEQSKKKLVEALRQYETNTVPVPIDIFSACETTVIENLLDTYRRWFVHSGVVDAQGPTNL